MRDIPRTVDFDYDIGEIAIGNPSIASVVVDRPKRRMVISPLSVGETAILVFDSRGVQRDKIDIVVTSTDLDQFVKDLRFLFRDIEGLSTRRVGGKIVLEGEVYLKKDLDRIEEVLRGNDFVVNLVSLSQDTQRILARRIKNEINISGVEVDTARDRIILKGEVATEDEKDRAEKMALIYVGPDRLVNVIAVNPNRQGAKASKLIQVNAYFVEVNKSFLRNFNFSWTPIADVRSGWQYPPGGQQGISLLAILTNFLPKLNTAKALGVARVFENPSVSVKSGDQASVKSGGQLILPVSLPDAPNSFSEPVELGVDLSVTPTADERDFVDMKVNVSVKSLGSSPQGSGANGGVLINQAAVNTSHYIRSGETVAVGGALRSAFSDVKDAPPGQPFRFQLGEQFSAESSIGNLFQVFKSRSLSYDRSMFIIFVTPEILV
ncbi:MAG: pilus assembly protein N-terminal domain-containing protein, partial [Bdellovibrionota bacterium]